MLVVIAAAVVVIVVGVVVVVDVIVIIVVVVAIYVNDIISKMLSATQFTNKLTNRLKYSIQP